MRTKRVSSYDRTDGNGSLMPSAFGQTLTSSGSSASAYELGTTSGYRDDGDGGDGGLVQGGMTPVLLHSPRVETPSRLAACLPAAEPL